MGGRGRRELRKILHINRTPIIKGQPTPMDRKSSANPWLGKGFLLGEGRLFDKQMRRWLSIRK